MNGKDTKDSLGKERERVADLLKQYFESAATRTRENEPPDDGDTNLHWSYTLLIDGRSGLPKEISKPALLRASRYILENFPKPPKNTILFIYIDITALLEMSPPIKNKCRQR